MSLSTRYNPQEIEARWYEHWMDKNYFHSEPDEREPFTILIPPPNVTGLLHMGHMLNNTIQDVLIRRARLRGYNACWVPGTDHASIATEAKVVKMLREKGIKKSDLSREEFLDYAFQWKEEYGGIILKQLRKLGASADWDRTFFTMEDGLSQAVTRVFVDLFKKGKLYRAKRMTNWDPEALTVLSNEEVIYKDEHSRLYHVRYQVADSPDEWVTIATTRPETILGDTAVAVHPDDERYRHLEGKQVIVPLVERAVPIIFDQYVDAEFGTGCLKVTPAHDQNDYAIGQRHGLEVIDVLNDNGTMSEAAQFYVGQDRFVVRKQIVKDLEAKGHIVKVEDYQNNVGRSERTNVVVEPRLTLQWFLDMKDFAATALEAVKSGEVTFYPAEMWNMYYSWLNPENVKDWCISRQLWWGQRIPAWYYEGEVFVAETAAAALEQARSKMGKPDLQITDLQQDEDVVDTWFSSWLLPLSAFNGFQDNTELKYYYPTNVLVTGWDIMFFWVARMIMSGYEWSVDLLGSDWVKENGRQPFDVVYFTGMVRDKERRKMSKSLGNSPDALALLDQYGADGVRFGMLSSASAGRDIIFDAPFGPDNKSVLNESKLCEQGRNFCNKMWNALRLIKGWEIKEGPADATNAAVNSLAVHWFENNFQKVLAEVDQNFTEYRLSEAMMNLYGLIWNDFCSWYLEMVKPAYGEPIDRATYEKTLDLFQELMVVLHPFMPFVTEEIWHQLRQRPEGDDCIVSTYPVAQPFDAPLVQKIEKIKDLITNVRDLRNKYNLKAKELLTLYVEDTDSSRRLFAEKGMSELVVKMGALDKLQAAEAELPNAVAFLSGTEKYFLDIQQEIDVEEERKKLQEELDYSKGFVRSVEKKLSNERFVGNAPEEVVERERQKLADGQARIKILEENLANLA